jgi:type IV pilus biogenesis protein CpaD/CtpE
MQTQLNNEENNEIEDEYNNTTSEITAAIKIKISAGSADSLKSLRDNIELLSEFHQIEILRILYSNHITFSENKNGVFVNLSYVNYDVIHKINDYVTFVNKQETQLCEFEEKKILLSNQYFK